MPLFRNRSWRAVLALASLTTLSGCDSQASGNDAARIGVLETQVAELRAQLQALDTRVTGTEANRPAVFVRAGAPELAIVAGNGDPRRRAAQTPGNPCSTLGTLTGRPTMGDPIVDRAFSLVSCTGYLYRLADDGVNATVQDLPVRAVYFETPDCTGPAYISPNFRADVITPAARAQGMVGLLRGEMMMLPAGAQPGPGVFALESFFDTVDGNLACVARFFEFQAYPAVALVPNDPTISGVENTPLPSPVTVGG